MKPFSTSKLIRLNPALLNSWNKSLSLPDDQESITFHDLIVSDSIGELIAKCFLAVTMFFLLLTIAYALCQNIYDLVHYWLSCPEI